MSSKYQLSFEAFWQFANKLKSQNNTLDFHPCCEVWTTRKSKAIKESHETTITWGNFILTLDDKIEDKETAFKAKMKQDNMKTMMVINKPCVGKTDMCLRKRKPIKTEEIEENLPFKLHNTHLTPIDLHSNFEPKNLSYLDSHPFQTVASSGMYHLTRCKSISTYSRCAVFR